MFSKKKPLSICYGMGVDSTAVLVKMVEYGIKPDLILFADTGGEKPETYAYLPIIQKFLKDNGFPPVIVVKFKPVRAKYTTLEDKQLTNQTLPALAFGLHTCSIIFKKVVQEKFIKTWQPAIDAWANGETVTRVIGYDAGKADLERSAKIDKKLQIVRWKIQKDEVLVKGQVDIGEDIRRYENWYPLQDWGLSREDLPAIIKNAGLPVPVKSACFFCPASKKHEIIWLRDNHPDYFARALEIEANFLNGKNNNEKTTCKGLGRYFAWAELADSDGEHIKENNLSMP